ncbi:MAG: zinc-dependent metalloprotease, partial [Planctomycetaceae bacterium]|nr:zinc-dependent metalloprotease [Planctomycetaceae bacterium]
MLKRFLFTAFFVVAVFINFADFSYSQDNNEVIEATPPVVDAVQKVIAAATSTKKDDKPKPIKEILPDAEKIDGLITLYRKKDRLLAEIKGSNLNTDYLIALAIAKGSGLSAIGGYTLSSGGGSDDRLWQFRKVADKIHVVRRNIKFKANPGTPEELAVDVAYSDNTIYSLPIIATGEGGGDVIDFGSIFMSDFPQLGMYLGSFSRDRSYWGAVKGFQNNIEFRVVATYSGRGFARFLHGSSLDSADTDGATVTIHYSVSKLSSSGYSPRLADNRIGYFTTVHKNYSKNPNDNHLVRYINRWNLQKADPSAKLSPPKKPIIFWISKTVPFRYRKAVREGILEWNKAFEKIGYVNAIEVRQQADNDTWDAEDINYNTFRWITSDARFAMGPSHVNPLTGEILDADIIFDAGFVDSWRSTFNNFIAEIIPNPKKTSIDELKNIVLQRSRQLNANKNSNDLHNHDHEHDHGIDNVDKIDPESMSQLKNESCTYSLNRANEFALASLLFVLPDEDEDNSTDDNNFGEDNIDSNISVTKNDDDDDNNEQKKDQSKKDDTKKDDAKKDDDKKTESDKDTKKDDSKKDAKTDKKVATKTDNKKDEAKKPDRFELQKKLDEAFERFVLEGLKDVVMHEVGHTLGLRHNFKASSWLTLDEINNPKRSKEYGIAGSVMDYLPVNIAPKGKPQGDYFMTTLGPYDYLAIEYGYKNLSGGLEGEVKDLQTIASRQAEKGNNYATDEDVLFHEDPLTIRRDLG